MHITELRAENYMRITLAVVTPEGHVIEVTGKNKQGKSSLLSAIRATLQGAAAVPGKPIRDGATEGRTVVKLGDANGTELIVERRFTEKNPDGYLYVTSPAGVEMKRPQDVLKALYGALGFDPMKFSRMEPEERADVLRRTVTLDLDLAKWTKDRASLVERRRDIGRDRDNAQGAVTRLEIPADLPDEAPNVPELSAALKAAADHNTAVQQAAREREARRTRLVAWDQELEDALAAIEAMKARNAQERHLVEEEDKAPLAEIKDTDGLRQQIDDAAKIGDLIRLRDERDRAEGAVAAKANDYKVLTEEIDAHDKLKVEALGAVKLPVPDLAFDFETGEITYKGQPFDQASDAEKIMVSCEIGAALNPKLKMLICRHGNDLDKDSRVALAAWAAEKDFQLWVELVDDSGEIGIVMEEGHIKGQEAMVTEFEAGEKKAEPTETKADAPAEGEAEPQGEERAKAVTYLGQQKLALLGFTKPEDIETQAVKVKRSLQRYPSLLAEYQTAKLERLRDVQKLPSNKKKG